MASSQGKKTAAIRGHGAELGRRAPSEKQRGLAGELLVEKVECNRISHTQRGHGACERLRRGGALRRRRGGSNPPSLRGRPPEITKRRSLRVERIEAGPELLDPSRPPGLCRDNLGLCNLGLCRGNLR